MGACSKNAQSGGIRGRGSGGGCAESQSVRSTPDTPAAVALDMAPDGDADGAGGMPLAGGIFGPGGARGMKEQWPWASGDCHGGSYLSDNSLSALLRSLQSQPAGAGPTAPEDRGQRSLGSLASDKDLCLRKRSAWLVRQEAGVILC